MYQTLLDSGAAVNLIYEDVVRRLSLKAFEILEPLKIPTANGKILSIVTHQVTLRYTIINVPHEDIFVVAPISTHLLILGMLFLKCTDALIKWKEQSIHFLHALEPTDDPSVIPLACDPRVSTPKPVYPTKQEKRNSCHNKQTSIVTPNPIKDESIIKTIPFHALYLEEGK